VRAFLDPCLLPLREAEIHRCANDQGASPSLAGVKRNSRWL
jgi:hypothetical protein